MTLLDLLESPQITGDGCLQRVARLLISRPGEWISMQELARVGGIGGWRTRVSECRTKLGMTVEQRDYRVKGSGTKMFTVSEYRWVR